MHWLGLLLAWILPHRCPGSHADSRSASTPIALVSSIPITGTTLAYALDDLGMTVEGENAAWFLPTVSARASDLNTRQSIGAC